MHLRKNYRNLTATEQVRFLEALDHVKFWGVVGEFARLHEHHFHDGLHGGAHFLPWHREFLLRFERKLREKHADMSIPYWDSTVDQSASDPLWATTFLGRFNSQWGLGRLMGSTGTQLPSGQRVQEIQARATFDSYSEGVESVHGLPHNWVGGVMATMSSPGDPAFYMHHCWIDMLWARWQLAHLGAPYVTNSDRFGFDSPLAGYPDRTPRSVWDHHALGYAYDTEPPPSGSPAQGNDMQPGEALTPGRSITSPNQRYTLVYQTDGNLVLYGPKGWLWDSNTDGKMAGACLMQSDGNLVVYGPGGVAYWDSGTWHYPGSYLVVQDDGNVVMYTPSRQAVWATNTAQPQIQSFRAVYLPNHYVRHRNYLGEVSPIFSDLDRQDATFTIVAGLANSNAVSLKAVNFPNYYLRHQNFRLKLQPLVNDNLFRADATFVMVPGLADASMVSFRSWNYTSHHIRHSNYLLYLQTGTDSVYKRDATFQMVEPLVR